MNDNTNQPGGAPRKPIAKTANTAEVATPAPKKPTEQSPDVQAPPPSDDSLNLFKSAYTAQKIKQQNDENDDSKPTSPEGKAAIPVVAIDNEQKKKEKEKILLIFLIIATVVLFLSACLYLFFGGKEELSSTPTVAQSPVASAELASPFSYEQTFNVTLPQGIQDKFKSLYTQNTDFVGWLNVPGTSIDTPVYQSANADNYLKHDNYGTYTKYGVPYLDSYCGVENLSRNSTIYGHNFSNNLIFNEIENYENLDFYKANPVIEFDTLYADYKWKVIACFRSNGESGGDNGYLFYYVAAEMGDNSFMEFYDELKQRSYIHTDVDVQPTDKILTLSTCTYFFDRNGSLENARFALVARLVRDGESEYVNTDGATVNENVRYPQLYYDVFGGTNPYRNASKWEASGS